MLGIKDPALNSNLALLKITGFLQKNVFYFLSWKDGGRKFLEDWQWGYINRHIETTQTDKAI